MKCWIAKEFEDYCKLAEKESTIYEFALTYDSFFDQEHVFQMTGKQMWTKDKRVGPNNYLEYEETRETFKEFYRRQLTKLFDEKYELPFEYQELSDFCDQFETIKNIHLVEPEHFFAQTYPETWESLKQLSNDQSIGTKKIRRVITDHLSFKRVNLVEGYAKDESIDNVYILEHVF